MSQKHCPWYQQFWPWFLIILPGSVVLASIITIIIASSQPKDTIDMGYKKMGLSITHENQPKEAKP